MIQLLALDDVTYDDLVAQARALIPTLCPEWTDHNPSDPGIALIELFAWLCEMVVYRTNRVPEASRRAFLGLLAPRELQPELGPMPLEDAVRATIASLRAVERAVTPEDFEHLTLRYGGEHGLDIRRVRCVPGYDLLPKYPGFVIGKTSVIGHFVDTITFSPGTVSVVVLTGDEASGYAPAPAAIAGLKEYLAARCLLTTHPCVVGPRAVHLTIHADLYLAGDGDVSSVASAAAAVLRGWFHPLHGGPDGTGWPFGRRIHAADVYRLLDSVAGLDFVEDAAILRGGAAVPDGVDMMGFEVPVIDGFDFQFMQPAGGGWQTI